MVFHLSWSAYIFIYICMYIRTATSNVGIAFFNSIYKIFDAFWYFTDIFRTRSHGNRIDFFPPTREKLFLLEGHDFFFFFLHNLIQRLGIFQIRTSCPDLKPKPVTSTKKNKQKNPIKVERKLMEPKWWVILEKYYWLAGSMPGLFLQNVHCYI